MTEPSPRSRRQARRKAELYRVALELFVERGFDQVTVDEIVAAADVAKGTFFNYFPSKEHLLAEYRRSFFDDVVEFGHQLEGDSARGLFKKYFRRLSRRVRAEGERYEMLFLEVVKRPHLMALDERQGAYRADFMRYLEVGRAAGEVPDVDLELLAETIRDLWGGASTHWLLGGRQGSLEGLLNRRLDLLFDLLEAAATP